MRTLPRNILILSSLAAIAGCTAQPASTPETTSNTANVADATTNGDSPVTVVERHVASMKTGKLDAIMSDYAPDTVVIAPEGLVSDQKPATGPGVFSGKDNAQKVFTTLTNAQNIDGIRGMITRVEPLGNDVAFLHWTQFKGTPKEASGKDVFIVRNGKVAFQDIIPNAK